MPRSPRLTEEGPLRPGSPPPAGMKQTRSGWAADGGEALLQRPGAPGAGAARTPQEGPAGRPRSGSCAVGEGRRHPDCLDLPLSLATTGGPRQLGFPRAGLWPGPAAEKLEEPRALTDAGATKAAPRGESHSSQSFSMPEKGNRSRQPRKWSAGATGAGPLPARVRAGAPAPAHTAHGPEHEHEQHGHGAQHRPVIPPVDVPVAPRVAGLGSRDRFYEKEESDRRLNGVQRKGGASATELPGTAL